MKEKWIKMPKALQRQVLFRSGGGGLFLMILLFLMTGSRDLYLLLPCVLCMFWLAGSGFYLFLQAAGGNYMRLQGQCIRIDTSGLRKRVHAVHLALEQGTVKIPIRQRIRRLSEGDTVSIYVAEKTPVYEQDGLYIISSYYAMEIHGRCGNGKGGIVSAPSGDQG